MVDFLYLNITQVNPLKHFIKKSSNSQSDFFERFIFSTYAFGGLLF